MDRDAQSARPADPAGGVTGSESPGASRAASPRVQRAARVRSVLRRALEPKYATHPGLIPGISVEDTGVSFPTRRSVFLIALVVALAVIIWAFTAPGNLNQVGTSMQSWVVAHFGWLFSAAVVATVPFMLVVGYGPTGRIGLGADDSTPEYSTVSWISMLFAAGLGIGLIFYGPLEPLSHFLAPPPSTNAQAASVDAILPAMTTAILHQATFAWCIYALVGGSLAYASFRRGRLPLISSLFEPVFPNGNNRVLGKIIDVFSILVTLFAPRMHRKGIGTTPGANRPYPTSALRGDGAGLSRAPRADEAGYLRFWVDQYRGSGPRRR